MSTSFDDLHDCECVPIEEMTSEQLVKELKEALDWSQAPNCDDEGCWAMLEGADFVLTELCKRAARRLDEAWAQEQELAKEKAGEA